MRAGMLAEARREAKGADRLTYFPWQTFWSLLPRKGANGQLT
jgi:hypothetical protein